MERRDDAAAVPSSRTAFGGAALRALRGRALRLGLAATLAGGIFLVDTFTMLRSAVAVLYVLVLVMIEGDVRSRQVAWLAWLCSGLATVSFLLNHGPGGEAEPLLRLLISIAAIAVTGLLLRRGHRIQLAARATDRRYRTIFDTIAIAIWEHDFRDVKLELLALRSSGMTDLKGYLNAHPEFVARMRSLVRITDANDTALRLLKVPTKEHFFEYLSDFLPPDDRSFRDCIVALDEESLVFETETQVRTMEGELLDVFVNLSFPPHGEGLERICGSIMDVTERKRVQNELERTRIDLDQAIRAATVGEVSASIAHEVSQPLSAVRAFTDAARRWLSRKPPNMGEALAAVHEAAKAAATAGDVIDRIRRLASKAPPERIPLEIDAVIRCAVDLGQQQIKGTFVDFDFDVPPARVLGDKVLLQQMFLNLIVNAVEAMRTGDPTSRRLQVRSRRLGGRVIVSVADSGPGFSPDEAERAFVPFFSTHGGLGVGLPMCRTIVEAHDGTIIIGRSTSLGGALIEIDLPSG